MCVWIFLFFFGGVDIFGGMVGLFFVCCWGFFVGGFKKKGGGGWVLFFGNFFSG